MSHLNNSIVRLDVDNTKLNWVRPYTNSIDYNSSGTGFFVSSDQIVTCAHVVDNMISIRVYLPDSEKPIDASIQGISFDRDIALLKVKDHKHDNIIELGDADKVSVGDKATVVGYPLGHTEIKHTVGSINGRQDEFLQVDTTINKGNSGGPLIDSNDKVIGIVSQKIVGHDTDNIGYVIPINDFKLIREQMEKYNDKPNVIIVPYLGATLASSSAEYIKSFKFSDNDTTGCYIAEIFHKSPLCNAGVKHGDVLTMIDNHKISNKGRINVSWHNSPIRIDVLMHRYTTGTSVPITYLSNDGIKHGNLDFTPDDIFAVRTKRDKFDDIDYDILHGMILMDLSIDHVQLIDRISTNGITAGIMAKYVMSRNKVKPAIIVTDVLTGTYFRIDNKVISGDILKSAGGKNVGTIKELRDVIRQSVNRGDKNIKLIFESGAIALLIYDDVVKKESETSTKHHFKSTEIFHIINDVTSVTPKKYKLIMSGHIYE